MIFLVRTDKRFNSIFSIGYPIDTSATRFAIHHVICTSLQVDHVEKQIRDHKVTSLVTYRGKILHFEVRRLKL